MKTITSMKNYGLAILAMMVMLTAANAQSRYKHVPRVKVDKKNHSKVTMPVEKATTTTTAEFIQAEENNVVASEVITVNENTTVASAEQEVVVNNNKSNSVVHHNKVVKNTQKADKDNFTNTVKDNSKLMDVKDVKKAAMERWLLWMIICLAIAVVFTILAAVFIFVSYVLSIVFWIIAGLAWLGAVVFLILGLAGIF